MEKTITLTVAEQEAGNIIRALKSRASYWNIKSTEAEEHESIRNYRDIAERYRALAAVIESQTNEQR